MEVRSFLVTPAAFGTLGGDFRLDGAAEWGGDLRLDGVESRGALR
jgi:hypothetical protein